MAFAESSEAIQRGGRTKIIQHTDASVANTENDETTATSRNAHRLLSVKVRYSVVTTVGGSIVITLDSGAGTNYDHILQTIVVAVGVQDISWSPPEEEIIAPGDAIQVVVPAAGAAVLSYTTVYTEEL